jgi:hypothetical protein
MSAPQSGVYDESMVVVAEGPKSVGWHDHHGMELTHVREFEPRYARGVPLPPFQDRVSLSTLLAPKRDGRDSFVFRKRLCPARRRLRRLDTTLTFPLSQRAE